MKDGGQNRRVASQRRREGRRAKAKTGQLAIKTRGGNDKGIKSKEKGKEVFCMQTGKKKGGENGRASSKRKQKEQVR